MKVNDGLKITAITAMAIAVWTGAGSIDASATVTMGNAHIAPEDIQVSGKEQKVYINVSNLKNEEVMFGMATKGSKSDKITFKVSAWDIFEISSQEEKEIAVDLSKLSNIKDNFIAIKTDSMEVPIIIKIPKVPKAASVTYNAASHELEFKVGEKKSEAELKAAIDYEWRTQYSNWNSPKDAEEQLTNGVAKKTFDEFKYQGATLYIRTPGEPKAPIKETEDTDIKAKGAYDANNIDKKITVYDAGSFPGKEAKLNIAKQANGPSVAAKYTSGTLTLPSSAEYRVVTIENGVKNIPNLTSNPTRTSVPITNLLPSSSVATQGILEVRTKESNTGKKPKAASKWTRIPLSNVSELKVSGADGDITNSKVTDSKNIKILEITKNTDSISIANQTDDSYQIVVMAETETPKIDTRQTYRLSGKATVTIRNDKNGQIVYIRKAGDSRTKTWVSNYVKIGKVNLS